MAPPEEPLSIVSRSGSRGDEHMACLCAPQLKLFPQFMSDTSRRRYDLLQVDDDILKRLGALAVERGVSMAETLRQLVDAETCQMEREASALGGLSPQQSVVLEGLKSGLSVKEIAASLGILEGTVRTHILRIRERLNCADLLSLRLPRVG